MKPLSKEASDALSALKPRDPTAADEARVRKNLERTLGIVIPAATVVTATTAATAHAATTSASVSGASGLTALSLGAKAVAFVVAVGVGAVVAVNVTRATRAAEKPSVVRQVPAAVVVAAVAAPEQQEITVEAEPVPEPVAVAAPPPPEPQVVAVRTQPRPQPAAAPTPVELAVEAPPPMPSPEPVLTAPPPPPITKATYELEVETNFPNCDAATEMRSAMSARKLLEAERAEEAVWLLGAYQRRCPSGRWSDEAWAVRMGGLCKLGRNAEVTGLLQWFSTEYPTRRAAVVAELRSSCSEQVLKHGEPSAE